MVVALVRLNQAERLWEIDSAENGRSVREKVAELEECDVEDLSLSLDGMKLTDEALIPNDDVFLRVHFRGICGGKGGFGAQLRSLAKQRGKKTTTNFGACRDLSGRRLRHINDEILLQKWKESKDRGEEFKADQKTPSGIGLWFLATPTWADKVSVGRKRGAADSRYKTDICLDWKRARERGKVPNGAPMDWGCPRGSRCEFAHGESDLRGAARQTAHEDAEMKKQREREEKKDAYMRPLSAMKAEDEVRDLVLEGLRAAKRAKLSNGSSTAITTAATAVSKPSGSTAAKKGAIEVNTASAAESVRLVRGQVAVHSSSSSEATTAAGESISSSSSSSSSATIRTMVLTGGGQDQAFSTVLLPWGVEEGQWFWECTLLTDGLMQLGWAMDGFTCAEEGDGVGDDSLSFAFDGLRGQLWHQGSGRTIAESEPWQIGDVISCLLHIDASTTPGSRTARLVFLRNGKAMGEVWEQRLEGDSALYPALSLEKGEAVALHVYSSSALSEEDRLAEPYQSYLPLAPAV